MTNSTLLEPAENEAQILEHPGVFLESSIEAATKPASVPARANVTKPYYGWYMLAMAMAAAIASSPGQTFGVSIFNEPLRLELGLSHGQLSLAYMLGTLLGALPILWIGYQMDRWGLRKTLLTVVGLFSLTCVAMSAVQSWLHVVLAFTFLRMLGPGALSLLSGNVLPFWFSNRLGTVEGLRQTAMAMAMAAIPPLNVWLVAEFGWRSAYSILGLGILLLLFPIYYLFFRTGPEEVGQQMDGAASGSGSPLHTELGANGGKPDQTLREPAQPDFTFGQTLRTSSFWLVLSGTSLFGMIQTGVFFCLVPIFAEHGWSEQQAAAMLVLFAVSLAFSQVIGGWLSDRVAPRRQLMFGMLLLFSGLTLLWSGLSLGVTLAAGIFLGAAQGIYFSAAHPLWPRYYGRLHLGKLRGVMMATNVATSSLGPLLVGVGHDVIGGFAPVLLMFALLPLPFALAACWVTKPAAPCSPVAQ